MSLCIDILSDPSVCGRLRAGRGGGNDRETSGPNGTRFSATSGLGISRSVPRNRRSFIQLAPPSPSTLINREAVVSLMLTQRAAHNCEPAVYAHFPRVNDLTLTFRALNE